MTVGAKGIYGERNPITAEATLTVRGIQLRLEEYNLPASKRAVAVFMKGGTEPEHRDLLRQTGAQVEQTAADARLTRGDAIPDFVGVVIPTAAFEDKDGAALEAIKTAFNALSFSHSAEPSDLGRAISK